MDTYLIIIIFTLTLLYLLYSYVKKQQNHFKDFGIPYIEPKFFFGNIRDALFGKAHFSTIIKAIYNIDKEARYVGAFNLMSPVVVVRDLELIKSITIKNFDNFMDHKGFEDVKLDPIFANNLFAMKGDRWKQARNLLSPVFTSSKIKAMFELMIPCAENIVGFIKKMPDTERKMIDTKDLFTRYTNDVIATCAFGITVDSLNEPKNEFYVLGREAANLDSAAFQIKALIATTFPSILKLLNIKFVSDKVRKFFENIISGTIKIRKEKGITRPDMIQIMMNAQGKTSENFQFNLTEMTGQAFQFFFDGSDTASSQMCLMAHELALYPEIQKKLQNEIDAIVDKSIKLGEKVTYEAINGMQYLDAIFSESIRRHPQASFVDRLCTQDFQLPPALPGLKDYMVRKGEVVWIPIAAIHSDPQYYDNPDEFDPDRFLEKKSTAMQSSNLGFGIGPRACIGIRFTTLETKILMFYLLMNFNFVKNQKTCDPLIYKTTSIALTPPGGFWISIESRN